jgi:hypothetical protein
LSAFQRFVRLARLITTLSAALTILCAVMVVGLQVTSWIKNGVWEAYLVSSVIESMKSDRYDVYITASVDRQGTVRHGMLDWVMGIPAIVPLVVAAVLHFAFYSYLATLEEKVSKP